MSIRHTILSTLSEHPPLIFSDLFEMTHADTGQDKTKLSKTMSNLQRSGLVFRNTRTAHYELTEDGEDWLAANPVGSNKPNGKNRPKAASEKVPLGTTAAPNTENEPEPEPRPAIEQTATVSTDEKRDLMATDDDDERPDMLLTPKGIAALDQDISETRAQEALDHIFTIAQSKIDALALHHTGIDTYRDMARTLIEIRNTALTGEVAQ